MLIPSIDLMGGKIVQLVQGEKKALEFDDFEPWLERFAKYPLVQIIDLDAAHGAGGQPRAGAISASTAALPGGRRNSDRGASSRNAGRRRFARDYRVVSH